MSFPTMFYIGTACCILATAAIFIVNFLSFRLSDKAQNTAIGCAAIVHFLGLSFLIVGAIALAVMR